MPVTISGTNGVTFPDSSLQAAAASPYVLKNRIINGDMRIDQRNAGAAQTITTSGAYNIDRFFVLPFGSSCTAQRVTGISGFQYALRLTGASGNSQIQLQQKIESANTYDLINQNVTISFYAQASSNKTPTVYFIYPNSTDSWAGGYTQINASTFNVTTSSQRFSFTFNAGANAGNGLGIIIADAAFGSGETFTITGVQLEVGTSATPFERRLYNQELANCQRYFEMSYDIGTTLGSVTDVGASLIGGSSDANQYFNCNVIFKTTKRATPTMTLYNAIAGGSGTWTYRRSGVSNTSTTALPYAAGMSSVDIYGSVGTVYVACFATGHWTASAEL